MRGGELNCEIQPEIAVGRGVEIDEDFLVGHGALLLGRTHCTAGAAATL